MNTLSKQSVIIHMFFRSEPPIWECERERETICIGNDNDPYLESIYNEKERERGYSEVCYEPRETEKGDVADDLCVAQKDVSNERPLKKS